MIKHFRTSRELRTARSKVWMAVVLAISFPSAFAGVVTDGSVGSVQNLAGNMTIPQSLGRLSGNNLFHSFQSFNVLTGESANFTTTTSGIANVVSRVTGGSLSQINGLLSLTPCAGCGAPNFFFINPAGVMFGAGASINVPGAFHVSTADYVRFQDGNFYAALNQASTFSSAPPEAFGFLGATRASVTVNGTTLATSNSLQPISIVAGDVAINNGGVATLGGGDIRVVALGQNTREIGLAGALPAANGNLDILNGGQILSAASLSANGGNVDISAGTMTIDKQGSLGNTGIYTADDSSWSYSFSNAGAITLSVSGNLSVKNGGAIKSYSSPFSFGNPGMIKISSGSLTVDGGSITSDVTFLNFAAGNAGGIDISVNGGLSLLNGGQITSDTFSSSQAGSIKIVANTISSNGGSISSTAYPDPYLGTSSGNAGSVDISASGSISLVNSTILAAATPFTTGNAGSIKIAADSLGLDGLGLGNTYILASTAGSGNAGTVDVTLRGVLSVVNGSRIASETYSSGQAGMVNVAASNITLDGQGYAGFTGISSDTMGIGNAGYVGVTAAGSLSIVNGGAISSDTWSSGSAGLVQVNAGSIVIDGQGSGRATGIFNNANAGSTGNAGYADVTAAGNLSIVNGGMIASDTWSSGNAGAVWVNAGSIAIDRQGSNSFTGISSDANAGSSGSAGFVDVTATGNLSMFGGGTISSTAYSSGNAGAVRVNAGSIVIDGQGNGYTGIMSDANPGSTGSAGYVDVTAAGGLSITNGGRISSVAFSSGNAGYVWVNAGSISIDGQGGNLFTGISSDTISGTGNAGLVDVTAAGNLSIINGGVISSTTSTSGNAGTVTVNAGSINIDGKGLATGISSDANIGSTGNAGSVFVTTTGSLSIADFGGISSSTYALGNAGAVSVNAGSIAIDGKGVLGHTGIASDAYNGSTGNAGTVDVSAQGALSITRAGAISSTTFGAGYAGAVLVSGSTLLVDGAGSGIYAAAMAGTSGQTGNVVVTASDSLTLSNGGGINIGNLATVAAPALLMPTSISVTAPRIAIMNSPSAITTSSAGNVAAGSIDIKASDRLFIDPSGITTTSNLGNGGAINIQAGTFWLVDSQVATSVAGLTGNGGNISIAANTLILNTGFIQANTAAANATGGTVSIAVQNLIPSGNTLFLGGNTPYTYQPGVFGFNVIQAAAPTGVSGTVQTTTPALDIAGSLSGLVTQMVDTGGLGRSPCQVSGGSSMAQSGRGGLPPSARGLLRAELNSSPTMTGYSSPANGNDMRLALSDWSCS